MKILFLDAYFLPEKTAYTHLEQDLLSGLVAAGHSVQILCPMPTRGVDAAVAKQYRKRKHEEMFGGQVKVRRFWAPQEGKNVLIRALRYFWCNLRQYQLGLKYKNIDRIYAVSTPPTQGLLAGKLAKKLGCRFVYNLQDVFPDSLVFTGIAKKDSLPWKLGRIIEDKTYDMAEKIIVISRDHKENIMKKGVPEAKINLVPNWIDTEATYPVVKKDNRLYAQFGIDPEVFTVVYAGNLGAAQDGNLMLEAAVKLPAVQFVIFGGGSEYEDIRKKAEKLPNVTIHPLLSQDRVPEVYSLGDVALILGKKGIGSSGVPSKTWTIMACGTPIIAAVDTESELAQTICGAEAGICLEPGDPEALAAAITAMQTQRERYAGGRAYVCDHASKTTAIRRYLEVLER